MTLLGTIATAEMYTIRSLSPWVVISYQETGSSISMFRMTLRDFWNSDSLVPIPHKFVLLLCINYTKQGILEVTVGEERELVLFIHFFM